MKNLFLIAAILLTVQLCSAQQKFVSIPGDTFLWKQWQKQKFQKARLPDLGASKESLHIRFSTDNQAIDVWTTDYKTFYGTFADFTTSYDPDTSKNAISLPEHYFSKKTNMDTAFSRQVYNLFKGNSIFSIPTSDSIPGWTIGRDGDEYVIEYATPTVYSVKYFWNPATFKDKVKEAAAIDNVTKQLETMLHLRLAFKTFIHTLPEGCYHSPGGHVMCQLKNQ